MNTQEFLEAVITTPEGYLELGIRNGAYKQHWYEWPTHLPEVLDHALNADGDVYFSAHLFLSRDSHKDNVLPSRTIQADLDNADASALPLAPTILVSTSPQRHQGFWVASAEFDSLQVQELTSKKLTYSIPLCDRSGWPLGHKVRLPQTRNYKYKNGPHQVQVVKASQRLFSIDELDLLPDLSMTLNPLIPNGEFIDNPPTTNKSGAFELVESIKDHISAKVYAEYMQDVPTTDRSRSLYALMTQCFRAGLPREDVYWVAYNSANNKFLQDLRYNDKRELAKDVIRAEHEVKSTSINLREVINDIRRKSKVLSAERMRAIYELIETSMKTAGEFVHVTDGRRFYIPTDSGKPIDMDQMEDELHNLLDIKYSLNRTEREHGYCISGLCAHASALPETYKVSVLAKYDHQSKTVLVHSGRKDIYAVTSSGISTIPNGSYNTVFPWDRGIEPFYPTYEKGYDWASQLFSLPNVINMTPEEAKCILQTWILFAMLRDMAASRPILGFLGQPGCLASDTKINVCSNPESKHSRRDLITIKELYVKFIKWQRRTQNQDVYFASPPPSILCLNNEVISYKRISNVIYSGVQETALVTTRTGRYIRATKNHLFLTPKGFVKLEDLSVGSMILCRKEDKSSISKDTIVSIGQYIQEETYDITMEDETAPNFVANNFVVHNSGKTSTSKRIYAFMYGRYMNVSGATNSNDYDIATASLPFYVLDNLDTWEKWIPDRLAQSAGDTDVLVRKLYTNAEVIRIKRQAMVAVTAHDPKFGRADVTDRMLIISLARFSNLGIKFDDEGAMLRNVLQNRNKIWGGVLQDLQRIVSTPFPTTTKLQLRIQDFARIGEWINIALDQQDLFKRSVTSLQAAQRAFNLDEDHILVAALTKWTKKQLGPDGEYQIRELTQEDLYQEVIMCVPTDDYKTFTVMYKSSGGFVRRLSTLQDTLNATSFKIEFHANKKGERVWTVRPRED